MKEKVAIIGTGIAGMAAAYFLKDNFELTIFEKNNYAGGHTNTVTIRENDGRDVHIDTGFMVFNHVTYPCLTRFFEELEVETMKTSMSFSVQHLESGLEYCGSGFNGLFAQRKNIFNVPFIKMLMQINKFNSESVKLLARDVDNEIPLGDFINELGLGKDFLHKYLIPMSSAVWSTPTERMLDFPATSLVRFFKNHGFLGLNTQHQWYTVSAGSRMYRDKVFNHIPKPRLSEPVKKVSEVNGKAHVITETGTHIFDKVIFACHADEALNLLSDPTELQSSLLSHFKYQLNIASLHSDSSVMPQTKSVWSSWNYRIESKQKAGAASTIYWMNSLQNVSKRKNYFVSINDPGNVDEARILKRIKYTHPLFDVRTAKAQKELHLLNEKGPLYFCGSYFRYGFHEDAFLSSIWMCRKILNNEELWENTEMLDVRR